MAKTPQVGEEDRHLSLRAAGGALLPTQDGIADGGREVAAQPLAFDLVALAFGKARGGVTQLSSTRNTTLMRLKAIIETRLHEPDLKRAIVAEAAGISVR